MTPILNARLKITKFGKQITKQLRQTIQQDSQNWWNNLSTNNLLSFIISLHFDHNLGDKGEDLRSYQLIPNQRFFLTLLYHSSIPTIHFQNRWFSSLNFQSISPFRCQTSSTWIPQNSFSPLPYLDRQPCCVILADG